MEVRSFLWGHGIQATGVPWMASRDTGQGQPEAAQRPMGGQGLDRIGRTTGCVSAGWGKPGAYHPLVDSNQADQDALHGEINLARSHSTLGRQLAGSERLRST